MRGRTRASAPRRFDRLALLHRAGIVLVASGFSARSQLPSDLAEKAEPIETGQPIVGACVRDLEGSRTSSPRLLSGHDGAAPYPSQRNDEWISPSALRLLVDETRAGTDDVSHGPHLRLVERHEEALSRSEVNGQSVIPSLEFVQDLLRRNDASLGAGDIEALPEGPEDVWRVVPADVNPDAGVDHVGRRHAYRDVPACSTATAILSRCLSRTPR